MSKIKRYTLTQQVRVSNSPYSVEGRPGIVFDVTPEFPIPNIYTSVIDGKPVQCRYLSNCDTIVFKEQIEQGWDKKIRMTENERNLLTFTNGYLEVDEELNKNLVEFLDKSPWNEANIKQKPRNVKTLFKLMDTEKEVKTSNDKDLKIARAIISLEDLKHPVLRDLLRLRTPGRKLNPTMQKGEILKQLNAVAKEDPDFIINGIKSNRDKIVIMVSKAVDFEIIKLDTVGFVSLNSNENVTPLFQCNETGGRTRKLEKTIEWFEGEEGKEVIGDIKDLIEKAEVGTLEEATNGQETVNS